MAKKQDRNKGKMTVEEAGKRGGEKTAKTYGRDFYSVIGQKGGKIGGQKVKRLIREGKKATGEK